MKELPKYLRAALNQPITAVIDTREQCPLDLQRAIPSLAIERKKLPFGDYSLSYPYCELLCAIERKSLDDLAQSIIKSSDSAYNNFKTELIALRGYKYKLVVVEGGYTDIVEGAYSSRLNPASVLGFIAEWSLQGIPFIFCDTHEKAGEFVATVLMKVAKKEIYESLRVGTLFPNITHGQLALLGCGQEEWETTLQKIYGGL